MILLVLLKAISHALLSLMEQNFNGAELHTALYKTDFERDPEFKATFKAFSAKAQEGTSFSEPRSSLQERFAQALDFIPDQSTRNEVAKRCSEELNEHSGVCFSYSESKGVTFSRKQSPRQSPRNDTSFEKKKRQRLHLVKDHPFLSIALGVGLGVWLHHRFFKKSENNACQDFLV